MGTKKFKITKIFTNFFKQINNWLANKLSISLSSMLCFWFILILDLLPLFFQLPVGAVAWMQYIISVIFQSLALPVLAVVAKKEGEHTTKILKETHDYTKQQLKDMQNMILGEKEQRDYLIKILEEQKSHNISDEDHLRLLNQILEEIKK